MQSEKFNLPTISCDIVFPNNRVEQIRLDKADGLYRITGSNCDRNTIRIKDGSLINYFCYLTDSITGADYLHLIWTFDYDEKMSIYREFPKEHIPKTIYYDRVNGRYDLEEQEEFKKTWNIMLAKTLNDSMQLKDNVDTVSTCQICDSSVVNCKDGREVHFCGH